MNEPERERWTLYICSGCGSEQPSNPEYRYTHRDGYCTRDGVEHHWVSIEVVPLSELTALREGLGQIAAQECFYAPRSCSPPVRCPTCIARQVLSGDEAKPTIGGAGIYTRFDPAGGDGAKFRCPSCDGRDRDQSWKGPIDGFHCPDPFHTS